MKKAKLKREFSAGGVVYKKSPVKGCKLQLVFLLGKHSGYHKWVLPKGLIEKGEEPWQTAIRETEEEMGVKTKLIQNKAIHTEKYIYFADLKQGKMQNSKLNKGIRRVKRYQEDGGSKVKVFKTVTFCLLEHISGDPKDHGWEMEEAGWFCFDKALDRLSFTGEQEALRKAFLIIQKQL